MMSKPQSRTDMRTPKLSKAVDAMKEDSSDAENNTFENLRKAVGVTKRRTVFRRLSVN